MDELHTRITGPVARRAGARTDHSDADRRAGGSIACRTCGTHGWMRANLKSGSDQWRSTQLTHRP